MWSEGTCYPGDDGDDGRPRRPCGSGAQLQVCRGAPGQARLLGAATLIRIETNAGHGAGKPTAMVIEEAIDKFAFALWNMGYAKLPNP